MYQFLSDVNGYPCTRDGKIREALNGFLGTSQRLWQITSLMLLFPPWFPNHSGMNWKNLELVWLRHLLQMEFNCQNWQNRTCRKGLGRRVCTAQEAGWGQRAGGFVFPSTRGARGDPKGCRSPAPCPPAGWFANGSYVVWGRFLLVQGTAPARGAVWEVSNPIRAEWWKFSLWAFKHPYQV